MASKRSSAIINLGKILVEIFSTTAAAVYGAQANVVMAGIMTLAGAGVGASDNIVGQLKQFTLLKEEDGQLELFLPDWWNKNDVAYWEGFCAELYKYLPAIFQSFTEELQQQGVATREVVRNLMNVSCG